MRKTKRIGRIWPQDGGYLLAPLDAIEGVDDYSRAEFISEVKFFELLDKLSGLTNKKPPRSEFDSIIDRFRKRGT